MSSSSSTVREWRWVDDPESEPIPRNWSRQGVEPTEEDQVRWYAVAYKSGTQLLWSVDEATGEPVDGPHREADRIAVVYVRRDCQRAIVRDYRAERAGGGWRPIEREYRSVRAFDPDSGGPVSPRNELEYMNLLDEYYALDPFNRGGTGDRRGSA